MKYLWIFSLVFVTHITNYQTVRAADSWKPVLQILNEKTAAVRPLLVPAATDLTQLYQDEMKEIKDAWIQKEAKAVNGAAFVADRTVRRMQRNKFYADLVSQKNAQLFSSFDVLPASVGKVSLSKKLFQELNDHPVARLESMGQYADGMQIGFCFGRALLAHHGLRARGISQNKIFKVFALGDMRVEGQMWKFHVAVLFREPSGAWMILDPMQKEPMQLRPWAEKVRSYGVKSPNSRVRFYLTEARKFLPAFEDYTEDVLRHPKLKEFFDRLLNTLPN